MEEGDGDLTDSTDVDDSMQRLPEASTSSRPVSPIVPSHAHAVRRNGSSAVPGATRPAALRKEARAKPGSTRHRSPASKPQEEVSTLSGPAKSRKDKTAQAPVKLYVCEGCFKYMVHPASYAIHFVRPSKYCIPSPATDAFYIDSGRVKCGIPLEGKSIKRAHKRYGRSMEKRKRYVNTIHLCSKALSHIKIY